MLFEKRRYTSSPPTTFAEFVVDEEKCTGCGRCVATCPTQVLELRDKVAGASHRYKEHRCITCQNCAAVCPVDAIRIEGDYRVHKGFFKNDDLFQGGKTMPQPISEYRDRDFRDYEDELTETERVIYKRRSVRLFKNKTVSREMIERIIEAGRFAPSAGNNQPWKFVVIDNRDAIDEIDRKCRMFMRLATRIVLPHQERDKKPGGAGDAKLALWQKLVVPRLVRKNPGQLDPRVVGAGANAPASDPNFDTFLGAPVLILLLAHRHGIGEIQLDCGMCGQNMTLAAHSLGLGVCYVGLIDAINYFPIFKRKLGIIPPFELITSLALGYPKGEVDKVVARERPRIEWVDKL